MGMPFGGGIRRIIAVGTAMVIGALIAVGAAFFVPKHYVATADVLLTPTAGATTNVPKSSVSSLSTVAEGPAIRDSVEAELGLGSLGDKLRAAPVPNTTVIRITGVGKTGENAASIAKAGAEAFIEWTAEQKSKAAKGVQASVVADADVPDDESYAPRWTWPIGAGLLGLLIGGIVPVGRRRADQISVTSVDDLAAQVGVPVLGVLGHEADLAALPLISTLPSGHPAAEAIRIVRTNLRYVGEEDDLRVLTVTSAVPAEGKSTTCCNLGISMAQTGRSVILVEGDLRRPQVAQYLGVDGEFGVTSVLTGQMSLDAAIQTTRIPGLDTLTSGPMPANPAEVLQTDAMADLLADLREMYDVVLVDAPPVLPVADAPLLAAHSDGVILLTKHGHTGRDQVRAAVDRIHAVDGEVVGAVLTMSPHKATQRFGYGYGYGPELAATRPRGHRA